jgi:hypothetical protein
MCNSRDPILYYMETGELRLDLAAGNLEGATLGASFIARKNQRLITVGYSEREVENVAATNTHINGIRIRRLELRVLK